MVTLFSVVEISWVLLSSRLPREPSRLRLGTWRRLRRLGAVLLHDALWVLPADAKTREAFEWLADEIAERAGTAFLWEAKSLGGPQDQEIIQRFRAEVDARYTGIVDTANAIRRTALRSTARQGREPNSVAARLLRARRQLRGLERALRLEWRRDYFRAPGRAQAEAALRAAVEALASHDRAVSTEGEHRAMGD
jgi:hypothetical protein